MALSQTQLRLELQNPQTRQFVTNELARQGGKDSNLPGPGLTVNNAPGGGTTFPGGGASGVAAAPFDLSGAFPEFAPVGFPTIKPAPFQLTDPQEFAKGFGEFNRQEFGKNFGQAQDFALQALNNELKGLQGFVPAASALKRSTTSADNIFNQQQRGAQVDQALPGVREDLAAQRSRAHLYQSGQTPFGDQAAVFAKGGKDIRAAYETTADSLRALDDQATANVRGRAADQATFAGFGPRSGQASKVSDLMTADELSQRRLTEGQLDIAGVKEDVQGRIGEAQTRIGLGQYGEGLEGQNIGERSNLFLAPTEYSQAGSEVRAIPEVGAGRLTYQGASMLNEATIIPPATALGQEVQQQEFQTGIVQRTNEFNATGTFDAAKFNSAGAFTAGLGLFNYDVGLAGQVQGASQANLNTAMGTGVAGINAGNFNAGLSDAQAGQTISSTLSGVGALPQALGAIQSVLNGGSSAPQQPVQVGNQGVPQSGGTLTQQTPPEVTPIQSSQVPQSTSVSAPTPQVDASTPATVTIPAGASAPSGYTPISFNPNGSQTAADISAYQPDVERFAKNYNVPTDSVKVESAALADKSLSQVAALSYVPMPGLKQVALSRSGRSVYSLPQAAESTNTDAGKNSLDSLALTMGSLGINDPETYSTVGKIADAASDPNYIGSLDGLYDEKGADAVAAALLNKVSDGTPDLSTQAGQQLAFTASRIGELWGGFSPYQKSMAMTAMTDPALRLKGQNPGEQAVPGTERSVQGPLKVKDAVNVTAAGLNGFSLARNWNQLSAVADIAGNAKGPGPSARVLSSIGMLGYGPQGASVPIDAQQLQKTGARAAPEFGVGALHFPSASSVPKDYTPFANVKDGGVMAVPSNLVHTLALTPKNAKSGMDKITAVALGNHPAQELWGESSPSGKIVRGSAGGSAVVSSLDTMRKSNPAMASSISAYSLYNNMLGA